MSPTALPADQRPHANGRLRSPHSHWHERLRAAAVHLGATLVVAALAAWLVFGLWYPHPYRDISGGRELFMLVVAVDVVLGPLLTFAIFSRAKPAAELRRDVFVVVLLQLAALGYGLWTVFVARPAHLAFEIDRFRVVHAVDVPDSLLAQAPPALRKLPLTGPTLMAVRPFKDAQEDMDATPAAVQGVNLGARSDLWQPYADAKDRVLAAFRPLAELRQRFPAAPGKADLIDAALARSGRPAAAAASLRYLPLVGRNRFWTVLLDPTSAEPLAFLPLDSF